MEKPNIIKRICSWCRNHKVITVLIVVMLASAVFFGVQKNKLMSTASQQEASYTFVRTTTLTKNGLEETVGCTGSVKSADTSTVSYNSMGSSATTKIKTVNFAVGDAVKEGDIVVVLDNADILEKIEEEKTRLADKVEDLLEKYEDAQEAYDDAKDAYSDSKDVLSAAEKELENAKAGYDAVVANVEYFAQQYEEAVKAEEEAGTAYNSAKAEYKTNMALPEEERPADGITEEQLNEAETAYIDAQSVTAAKKAELDSAKAACNFDSYEKAYNSAQTAYNTASNNKDQLRTKRENAKDSLELAEENYNNGQTSDTLEDLYEQLDDCNLVAETSGKITALNATVGAVPNGTIATIQDTDNLKISITISEADINSVEIGMSCNIRSDATDSVISGTLTQIDPVSGNSGSFGGEVKVNGSNTGLLVGMNADVDIIVSAVEDCFTVPIDAVGTDEEKGEFIYRHTTGEGVDMEFEKIYVTLGQRNDYYVEVYAEELAVGDVIRAYADLTVGIEEVTGEEAEQMSMFGELFGGMGNMPGNMPGGMPSGGGMPGGGSMPDFGGERPDFGGERPDFGGGMPSGGGMPGGFGG